MHTSNTLQRLIILLLCVMAGNTYIHAQGGTWVWMNGTKIVNDSGHYGTAGVYSSINLPPARYESVNWTDQSGNFWVFGGLYYDSSLSSFFELNDLWEYDVTVNQWVWINGPEFSANPEGVYGTQGVPSTKNYPSARAYGTNNWIDNNGDLWVFGGWGIVQNGSIGTLDDIWRYHIATNEWTWMGGTSTLNQKPYYGKVTVTSANNNPGSVYNTKSAWVDRSNNLWMFGGGSSVIGYMNVMWKYNISTNQWTWMKGDTTGNRENYGTLNVAASGNLPPSRWSYTRWKDDNGNFYIFGGLSSRGYLNDVWRYSPSTNNWTWIAGDSTQNLKGAYKTQCTLSSLHGPASRYENQTVQNMNCRTLLWTFGGYSDSVSVSNKVYKYTYNDLWLFNTTNQDWTWVSGVPSKTIDTGYYGTQKSPSSLNRISNREGAMMWTDLNNNIWVFGGEDLKSNLHNDMWKFIPDSACISANSGMTDITLPADTGLCQGNSTQILLRNASNVSISPMTGVTSKTSSVITLAPTASTSYTLKYISLCGDTNTVPFTIHVITRLQTLTDTVLCAGQSATLNVTGYHILNYTPATGVTKKDSTGLIFTPAGGTNTTYTVYFSYPCSSKDSVKFTIHTHPTYNITITASICQGQTYKLPNNKIVNTANTYIDTLTTRTYGCDSIITTKLSVFPNSSKAVAANICQGQTYTLPNNKIVSKGGTYVDTIKNYVQCDSVITTTLTVYPSYSIKTSPAFCQGHTYTLPNAKVVSDSGLYIDTLKTIHGCDSIIATHLIEHFIAHTSVQASICQNQVYILPNGKSVSATNTYIDTINSRFGCDSIITTALTVLKVSTTNITAAICKGNTYKLPNNKIVTDSGTYVDTLKNSVGCDSIITTKLVVHPIYNINVPVSLCQGQTYTLPNNVVVNKTGVYPDTFKTHFGCDSIITTSVTVHPLYNINVPASLCQGNTYVLPNGKSVSKTGIYIDTLKSQYGCDSIVTTNLTVHNTYSKSVSASICQGDVYILPNHKTVTSANIYVDTVKTQYGCDSIITTTLTVNPVYKKSITADICQGQTYTLPKNEVVTTSGVYADTFKTHLGCDSIFTTTLTVHPVYTINIAASVCQGQAYTLPNKAVVTKSGNYIDTLHTRFGCDSIITTVLVVHPVYSNSVSANICQGQTYMLPNGNTVSSNGVYIDTLHSQYGCDSVITTTLNVLPTPTAAFSFMPGRVILQVSPSVTLNNESLNGTSYTWLFQNAVYGHSFDTSILLSDSGTYCVTLKVENGVNCIDTITHCVKAKDTLDIMNIPNAFTPNGDSKNDIFFPLVTESQIIQIKQFEIFDRWGKLLYSNTTRGWDGTYNGQPQPQGTYVYLVVAEYVPANAPSTKVTKRGTVELIR